MLVAAMPVELQPCLEHDRGSCCNWRCNIPLPRLVLTCRELEASGILPTSLALLIILVCSAKSSNYDIEKSGTDEQSMKRGRHNR